MGNKDDNSESELEEKQREFYRLSLPHMDSLYSTALRYTRNPVDAEDLVQDVYVRAFRFFHKFEQGTNFKAWIFKILTNTYINQYRRQKTQPQTVDIEKVKFSYADEEQSESPNVAEATSLKYDGLFDDQIITALDQIPPEFRIVVLLADVESFSYKEIAQIIGCPIGTVMSRLSRGRRQLQEHLQAYAVSRGFIDKAK